MTDDLHATVLTVARQAAREAVARWLEAQGHVALANNIRAGHADNERLMDPTLAIADAAVSAALPVIVRALADRIVTEVAELPDRTSPDDWPEAMLVTADELRAIVIGETTP